MRGVNSFNLYVPRYEELTVRLDAVLTAALAESPWKRIGYEDARLGSPPVDVPGWQEALWYEEGRYLWHELDAIGSPPPWKTLTPPRGLVSLCLEWMRRYPGAAVLPPAFGVAKSEVS